MAILYHAKSFLTLRSIGRKIDAELSFENEPGHREERPLQSGELTC